MNTNFYSDTAISTFLVIFLFLLSVPIVYIFAVTSPQDPEESIETTNNTLPSNVMDNDTSPFAVKADAIKNPLSLSQSTVIEQQYYEPGSSIGETAIPLTKTESQYDTATVLLELEILLTSQAEMATSAHRLNELQDQLTVVASSSVNTRYLLIQALRDRLGTPFGSLVQEILAQISDPEIVELGFELIESNDLEGIKSGLALIVKVAPDDERSLATAERLIEQHYNEPQIVNLAIDIMMQSPTDVADADYNFSVLSDLTQHHDSAIRSASIFRYASLARDEDDLELVTKALHSPKIVDRMSATQALSLSSIRSNSVRDELIAKVNDLNENMAVRHAAAEGLYSYNLSIGQQETIARLRDVEHEL